MSTPNRGEVWIVDLGMAAKVRPAVVMSVGALSTDRALATIVPHTTSQRGTRFEVAIPVDHLKQGAFDVHNLPSIPHAKLVRFVGRLTPEQLSTLEKVTREWLGL